MKELTKIDEGLKLNKPSLNYRGRWGKLARRASRPSPFCRKLEVQWLRGFAQPIPLLQPTTILSLYKFLLRRKKFVIKKLIFDDTVIWISKNSVQHQLLLPL